MGTIQAVGEALERIPIGCRKWEALSRLLRVGAYPNWSKLFAVSRVDIRLLDEVGWCFDITDTVAEMALARAGA